MEPHDRPLGAGRRDRLQGDRGELSLPVTLGAGLLVVLAAVLAVRVATWMSADQDHPNVLVIGDSITDQGQTALKRELRSSYDVSIDGKAGARADEQVASAGRWATRPFDQVIVNLGTNDVMQPWPLERTEASLREILAQYPLARCLHLVTINEVMPNKDGIDAFGRARELNAWMRELAESDPRVELIDWAAIVNEQWSTTGVDPTVDGVHPRPEVQELLAVTYERALDACPQP